LCGDRGFAIAARGNVAGACQATLLRVLRVDDRCLGARVEGRFVDEAERITRAELKRFLDSDHMRAADPYERLASLGVMQELEGRLRWLAAVKQEMQKDA